MIFTRLDLIALLPFIAICCTIVGVMLAIAFRRNHFWNATFTVIGLNITLLCVAYAAWQGPHDVTGLLRVDASACFYMALILISTLACATLAHAYLEKYQGNREEFYLLLLMSAAGGLVLVSSNHLASLFLGLEILSVPLYGLVAYTFREKRTLEAGLKYLVLSAAASAFLLFGMALLYAHTGSLAFADIAADLSMPLMEAYHYNPLLLAGVAMILVAIAFKLSLVPFHLWTPDVYQGAPAPVGAYLATSSKVAVFAVLLRLSQETPLLHDGLLTTLFTALAIASILVGNLLALMQNNIKRLLGYSSIAHFGYLLIPLVAVPAHTLATEAIAVYLLAYVLTTLGAFGVIALMSSPYQGHDADTLYAYRGLFWKNPYLTAALTVMLLSLAGIPLTAGFIGKFYIAAVGVQAQLWWLLGALVMGSAIGVYYYLRVIVTLYLSEPGMRQQDAPADWGQLAGGVMVIIAATLVLLMGIYPQPALDWVMKISSGI
ncbi:MAG: NADH-quinone oxidoreductase subunit NuoN [Gammaproteobacteria bacterium]|nr:NADH-quinone oxidoreductase subunit NuoN [Gammaproteobacteria bacterium]